MGLARKISHFLAAVASNASEFKRLWSQETPPPTAANGLQGRWQGEWISEVNGHRGALRGLLARGQAGDYKATFHAVYARMLRVCYTVPLHGQWSEGKLKLEGDADLGPLAGGIYHYQGEAGETEFVCLYRCKYDHGIFRMKPVPTLAGHPSPRRRFITVARVAAAVLVAGVIGIVVANRRPAEASFRGHPASYWLSGFLDRKVGPVLALKAFDEMGTNADPVLVSAIGGRESTVARTYRRSWSRLPAVLRGRLPKPDEPAIMQMAAVVVYQHSASNQALPDLYPMLKEPDSSVRHAVLNAMAFRTPQAGQIPFLLLAANDPDPTVRAAVWHRFSRMEAVAGKAAPGVLRLCADSNIEVRQDAAWALWKLTRKTNDAVPVLESVLSQSLDASRRHLAAYQLLVMGDSAPFFVTALANSLTNSGAGDRAAVCSFLGQLGRPAAAAIPALRRTLQDPEPEVRRRAEVALSKIDPRNDATAPP